MGKKQEKRLARLEKSRNYGDTQFTSGKSKESKIVNERKSFGMFQRKNTDHRQHSVNNWSGGLSY
jgi:hypothetical protein